MTGSLFLLAVAALIPGAIRAVPGVVTINFDSLPAGTVVDVQFPEAGFGSEPGVVDVRTAAVGAVAPSPPNIICTVPIAGGDTCVSDLRVVFTDPVDNLSFQAIGAKSVDMMVAQVRVFERGLLSSTVDITSLGGGAVVRVDLVSFAFVTKIEIFNVTDPAGLGWDDFSFTLSPVNIFGDGFESGDTAGWSATVSPPTGLTVTKEFSPNPVPAGGMVTLEFVLSNSSLNLFTEIAFNDDLNIMTLPGLALLPLTVSTCDGMIMEANNIFSYSGGMLAPKTPPCTISLTLQVPSSAAGGAHRNSTSDITASSDGQQLTLAPAEDDLFVLPGM